MFRFWMMWLLVLTFGLARAQTSVYEVSGSRLMAQAHEMFALGNYTGAYRLYTRLKEQCSQGCEDITYYQGLSGLKAGQKEDIDAFRQFLLHHPTYSQSNQGYFALSTHYFALNQYQQARSCQQKIDISGLSIPDQEQFLFESGYLAFNRDEFSIALERMNQVTDYRGSYYIQSQYYAGIILYKQQKFSEALALLLVLDQSENEFQEDVRELIGLIYYKQHYYDLLTQYVKKVSAEPKQLSNKVLCRLAGEAYYELKQYELAANYLMRFVQLSGNQVDASVHFKLGRSYYEQKENQKATVELKISALDKGPIGQVSSFYLGKIYITDRNSSYALAAFQTARTTGSDLLIQEESLFLIGKINFQMQQYGAAIKAFSEFNKQYPNSQWSLSASDLLAQSYLNTSDFDAAIAYLENLPALPTSLKQTYQLVTLKKGQLLYNDSKFAQAITFLEKSAQFPVVPNVAAQAQLLLGEAYAMLEQEDNAFEAYHKSLMYNLKPWSDLSLYGLGYLKYNQKQFALAQTYFERFVAASSKKQGYHQDARLRLADCYYVQKDYPKALSAYQQLGQERFALDYITFQTGLIQELLDNRDEARKKFKQVIAESSSAYRVNAFFQLGQSYVENSQFEEALPPFTALITQYPESPLKPYALSKRALCLANLNLKKESAADYRQILRDHLTHPSANSALLGLQELRTQGLEMVDFDDLLNAYKAAHPDDKSLEVIAFESAKTDYFNQQYDKAISSLNAFISKYHESALILDANYYLADAYYRMSNWEAANQYFSELLNKDQNAYWSRALDKRGRTLLKLKQYPAAIENYRLMIHSGQSPKDQYLAREGLMMTFYANQALDSAGRYAELIIEGNWKPINAEFQARLIKAKVLIYREQFGPAMDELLTVINDAKNESGAEAKYLIARIYFMQKAFKPSLETLFDLNRNYGSYPKWIGQSFLLIADNYLEMNELLQARATLNSIIDNAVLPDIKREALMRLDKIKQMEQRLLVSDTLTQDSLR